MAAIVCATILSGIYACKKNSTTSTTTTCDGTASTYNSNMKTMINTYCTSSGCHPNYSTYTGIKSILTNGQFTSHVLSSKDMPRGSSLSSDQLSKIQCWADAGYPEK